MIKIDMHTHTEFSPDSVLPSDERIKKAMETGAEFIAVTDHMDINSAICEPRIINYNLYFDVFRKLQRKYPINIAIGIECGFIEDNELANKEVIDRFPFEYIINSVHEVDGQDCYFASYFEGKTRKTAYNDYFLNVLKSLDVPYRYDAVGHVGYITRNAPYEDKNINYKESGEIIDEILKKIIKKNKILEVNANIKTFSPHTPDIDIIKRYRGMGGELITYGSDAHTATAFLQNFDIITDSIKSAGFKYIFASKNRELIPVKL